MFQLLFIYFSQNPIDPVFSTVPVAPYPGPALSTKPFCFQVGENFENCKMHQRPRSAWVGQADCEKLDLNNRNHGGNCQRLSAKRDQFETRSI